MSEKFSRFPSIDCADLECHDSLELSPMDTEMQQFLWKPTDRQFLIHIYENEYSVNPCYLEYRQPFITNSMRSLLIDWVMEICSEFYLKRETCYKAISYIDRYLSESPPIKKEHFQLLGLSSCFLAAKAEEVCYPKVTDFIKSAGNIYTLQEIKTMERQILNALGWKILQPNSISICEWLSSQWDLYIKTVLGSEAASITLKDMAGFKKYREILQLIDTCTLDIGVLRFKPRIVAACACYLVLFKHFKEQKYPGLMVRNSYNKEYEEEYTGAFMEIFIGFVSAALEIQNFDEMYPCGVYLSKFVEIQVNYEFPNVCKTGLRPEMHYQEFLAYQTYNPLCIQAVQAKIRSNFN